MTHTPGPWSAVTEDDPRGQPVPYYAGLICLVQKGPEGTLAVVTDGRQASSDEWADNARLLAAAPELLEALKRAKEVIREWHDMGLPRDGSNSLVWAMYDTGSPEMAQINAAIAKASGSKSADAAELIRDGA